LLLVILITPSIASAAWWNPFTWKVFNKKEARVEIVSLAPITPVVNTTNKVEVGAKLDKPKADKNKLVELIKKPVVEIIQKNNDLKTETPKTTIEPKSTITLSISSLNIDPKITSVYISWQTNMASESKLLLNGTAYQSKNGVDALHYVEIKDLTSGHAYKGTITALVNNAWTSQEISFNTKEVPPKPVEVPVVLPTISFSFTHPTTGDILVEGNEFSVKTPKTDQLMWQNTATVGVRSVKLQAFKLRNLGSANTSAFDNLRLYVNDVQISSITTVDSNGYAVFEFSPIILNVGENTIKMVGDVVDGVGRTSSWSLRNTGDITLVDSETGKNINPMGSFPLSAGMQMIKSLN